MPKKKVEENKVAATPKKTRKPRRDYIYDVGRRKK